MKSKLERSQLLQEFHEYLRIYRYGSENKKKKYSPHTIDSYLRSARDFLNYLKCAPEQITQEKLEDYLEYLEENRITTTGTNIRIAGISRFIVFLNTEKRLQILAHVPYQDRQHQEYLGNVITEAEISQLVNAAKQVRDLRAQAILLTLAYTGVRVSELLQFQISDVTADEIPILGKGRKKRNIFIIPKFLRSTWKQYLKARLPTDEKALFTGRRGALQRAAIHKIIRKYSKVAAVPEKKCHAHGFRHFFGKYLADHGYRQSEIADILGHQRLDTTRIYVRQSKEEMTEKFEGTLSDFHQRKRQYLQEAKKQAKQKKKKRGRPKKRQKTRRKTA